jgi:uncharacterized protein YndB with AHSA1/START domain
MALDPGQRQVVSIDIAADADAVWAHLRDPEKIGRWFGWHEDGTDAIHQLFGEDARVAEVYPPGRRLGPVRSLSWRGGDRIVVSPSATSRGRRSRLTIARPERDFYDGFDAVHDDVDASWIASAQQLRFALEQHPGTERRTVCAAGLEAGPMNNRLLDRIGLHGIRGVPVGCLFETRRPDGSLLGGTIWHRTRYQIGVHLYGPTEPLMIIDETPTTGRWTHGHVTAVLSTFGADDETFATMKLHWNRWWGVRTPTAALCPDPPLTVRPGRRRVGTAFLSGT